MPIPTVPADAAVPRLAATVLLLRDGADRSSPEVLMLRRHAKAGFAASLWVFPGGVVDPTDGAIDPDHWHGIDPDGLADRFGLPADLVLAAHVAAVRETFEEAGVLLATHRDGRPADPRTPDALRLRAELNDRAVRADLGSWLRERDMVLDLGQVVYLSRWVTPIQEPKRFDTIFFATRVPEDTLASPDDAETTHARWITAADALEDQGFPLIFPTERTLALVASLGTADAVMAHARTQEEVVPVQPHILVDDDGSYRAIVLPDDDRYPHELYRGLRARSSEVGR